MSLRERKRLLTRDALYDAAVACIVENGYEATTMEQIAERALVSRATAYKYFPRKDDLLLEWAARRRDAAAARWQQVATDRPDADQVKALVGSLARTYSGAAGRAMVEAWLTSGGPLRPEAYASADLFARIIGDGQRAGTLDPRVDARLAGRLLVNAYLGALYQWAAGGHSYRWLRTEVDAAIETILSGLAVRDPRA